MGVCSTCWQERWQALQSTWPCTRWTPSKRACRHWDTLASGWASCACIFMRVQSSCCTCIWLAFFCKRYVSPVMTHFSHSRQVKSEQLSNHSPHPKASVSVTQYCVCSCGDRQCREPWWQSCRGRESGACMAGSGRWHGAPGESAAVTCDWYSSAC